MISTAYPSSLATATGLPATPPARRGFLRQLGTDTGYALAGLPLGVLGFVLAIAGVSLGSGLLITTIGLPVLAGMLYAVRVVADLERLWLPTVLRQPPIRPAYRTAAPGAGWWRRVLTPLGDLQSWLDMVHAILALVTSIIAFVVTVTWWAVALAGSLYWAYDWTIPRGDTIQDLSQLIGLGDSREARIGLNVGIGLFALLLLPVVVRGCALLRALPARGLLTGVAQVRNQITRLEDQKRAALSAEATALRRLERDIHDGPQQRLVRLAMDLGRARQQLGTAPDTARQTLDEALAQTRDTLAELRALSRGIAPPVLADRGLPSALAALAGRGIIPVDLTVDPTLGTPDGRLDPSVENTTYFVVAEALTNIAKHSQATVCQVTVDRQQHQLAVSITDDGLGGAHVAKGHGLAGLADRVHAAGGTLTVDSPVGGPTLIRAELPL